MSYDREAEKFGLYAIGRGGSGLRKLAEAHSRSSDINPSQFSSLSWSPKGDEILTIVFGHTGVAKADGSGYKEAQDFYYGHWSPDGSRIAVMGDRGASYLFSTAPDGSDERALVLRYTDGSLRAANPEKCFLWFCW